MGGKGSGIQTNVQAPKREAIYINTKPKKAGNKYKRLIAFQKANQETMQNLVEELRPVGG